MISAMIMFLGIILIVIGLAFCLFGCIGLVRLPDLYNQLQAGTKGVTMGTCSVLLGVFIISGFNQVGLKALLAMLFILVTSPTASHAIARGAHIYGMKLWDKSVIDKYEEDLRK